MKPEVIIIGGGVIGAASAYYLSRRGVRVLLLERGHLGAGASGVTASMIAPSGATPEPLWALGRESLKLLPEVEQDTGINLEIIRGGSISIAFEDKHVEALHDTEQLNRRCGVNCDMLDGAAAQQLAPVLSPRVIAALHMPDNYHVNPFRLNEAYVKGAQNHGATIRYGVNVRDITTDGRVVTNDGGIDADRVIVAAGAWTGELLERCDIDVPVTPGRGQAIITEACPTATPLIVMCPGHVYTRQTARGNFYLGSHTEYVGFDRSITLDKISTYARELIEAVPLLGRLKAIRFFCGFRPMVEDNLPLIGPLPDQPKLLIAAGHGRNGVFLSAATGQAISELIVDGASEISLDAMQPDRFLAGAAQ